MPTLRLHVPQEHHTATCGPHALAAILGVEVDDVLPLNPRWAQRSWTTPTDMERALESVANLAARKLPERAWPARGLCFVQWSGRWDRAPLRAQYRYTHWIATDTVPIVDGQGAPVGDGAPIRFVYDVNERAWFPLALWERSVPPRVPSYVSGASGAWWIRCAYEVPRPKDC
jgi:hypothetical protein